MSALSGQWNRSKWKTFHATFVIRTILGFTMTLILKDVSLLYNYFRFPNGSVVKSATFHAFIYNMKLSRKSPYDEKFILV